MNAALKDLKILDFSWVIAGPLMSKYLADYGATVVKIETAKRPDVERTSPPFKDGIAGLNRSAYFANWNPNKMSVSLNLKHPEGLKIAKQLIEWSDVVLENFTPGVMASWGIGYEEIKKINPAAILLSVSSYGQTGPMADAPGYGFHVSSLAGFVHATGWPQLDHPQRIGAYCDVVTPYFGVAALVGALSQRRKTGKGCCIDLSQYESGLQFMTDYLMDYQLNGNPGGRVGNRDINAAPHGAYRCQGDDRWIAISVFSEKEWKAFCKATGQPGWATDVRFKTFAARKQNEDALDKLVEGWTSGRKAEDAFRILNEAGVPSGVVQMSADLIKDPQMEHRKFFWVQDHREIGPFHALGEVAILSKTPAAPVLPAPCLGEHTEKVCREILGMSDEKFIDLLSQGVFE